MRNVTKQLINHTITYFQGLENKPAQLCSAI